MIKDTKFLATDVAPNPKDITHWIDLAEDPNGGVIRVWDGIEWASITKDLVDNTELDQIREQINTLQADIPQNTSDLNNDSDFVTESELQSAIQQLQTTISSLQTTVESLNTQIESLTTSNETLNTEITSLKERVTALENPITPV